MLRKIIRLNSKVVVRPKYTKPYYGIFKIRCFATRKVFIGGASDCDKRLREHQTNLIKGTHRIKELQEDFNKYTINRFEFKIIERIKGKDLKKINESSRNRFLNNLLSDWIKYYESDDKSKGYNTKRPIKRLIKVTTSLH